MPKQNSKTIIALFNSFDLADAAARFLKVWQGERPVKFGVLSVTHETLEGQIKTRNYGAQNAIEGAGTGVALGLIFGLVAGRVAGIALIRTSLVGAVAGALLGGLARREPELSP